MRKKTEYTTKIDDQRDALSRAILDRKVRKALKEASTSSKGPAPATVWLVKFDVRDKDDTFRKLEHDVDAVLLNGKAGDEVFLSIYSPGGAVTAYSNAAAQIERLRAQGFKVTGFVDEIAASGGYMMASVCDRIVANRLAFVGSIGVVAQMPIVEDGLGKLGVFFEVFTAGERKRTVVPYKRPSTEDKQDFQEKIDEMHEAFKGHVLRHRSVVPVALMNGDFFLAEAHIGTLVDAIDDSHSAMIRAFKEGRPVFRVHSQVRKNFSLKRLIGFDTLAESLVDRIVAKLFETRFTSIT